MAAAFPHPPRAIRSAGQQLRAAEQGQPARTGPGRALSPTATCVPCLLPGSGGRQPRARQRWAARSWDGSVCSWMGFKELIWSSAGIFLPFPGESCLGSTAGCAWSSHAGLGSPQLQPHSPSGREGGVLGSRGRLSTAQLPPGACWRGPLVTLTEAKGLQEISGCHRGGQGQSFWTLRLLCYSLFGGVFSSVQNKQR